MTMNSKMKKNFKQTELGHRNEDNAEEFDMLHKYKKFMDDEADLKSQIKKALDELEKKIIAQYPKLSIDEIKTVVVDKKWMAEMEKRIRMEMDNISHRLTQRIKELVERYETTLPELDKSVDELTGKVENHLKRMGFKW